MDEYNHLEIESKWQKRWEDSGLYKTPDLNTSKDKLYVLPQLPYPSGSGLHVGHAEVYTSCDIYARFKRMQGFAVLQPIGWDAFGLPAENFAIKNNVHPEIKTNESIENFRYQIQRMGISVDWDREVGSHQPSYYKWTQWFFLLMYKQGLAYRKKQRVNWCESCKTVLANEQVVDGLCERCDTEVVQRQMDQWFLRITEYADRLYDDLDLVDWPKETVVNQRNWIGRKKGINITYKIENIDEEVVCFTTRPDTNFGATFVVIGPEHPLVQKICAGEFSSVSRKAVDHIITYVKDVGKKSELERVGNVKDKTGICTELFAINSLNDSRMPIYVADYVLGDVGTGAVVGVPGHDVRDFEFAKKFNLPIIRVVVGDDGDDAEISDVSQVQEKVGKMINSEFLNGLPIVEAKEKMMDYLVEKGVGEKVVTFRLRDWSVSRQRFWGAPIPMVYDSENNLHPVADYDLPVMLPNDVDFMPTGQSPLTYSKQFQEGVESKYGKGWRREVDTLDTFMCSSWYYYRYLDPHNENAFASEEALKAWMPVDFHIGGPEHTNGHLLYTRFFTKVLFDAGYIDFKEPFLFHRHQGLILGADNRKMSKRWGNVINPTDVMDRHGADTLRIYEMFMGPLSATKAWNTRGEIGIYRFLHRIWSLKEKVSKEYSSEFQEKEIHSVIKKATLDVASLKFNTAIARFMEFVNFLMKEDQIEFSVWERFIILLAPFAPHFAEELWESIGNEYSVHMQSWPIYDDALLTESSISIVIQVNGKNRSEVVVEIEKANDKEFLEELSLQDVAVKKWISDSVIKRVVVVPGKLVNIVI